jgi:hypothetical protein
MVRTGSSDELWGLYYGQYVITGTRPHVIKPKNKKFLRFVVEGDKVVFTKLVNHPGTKANDFRQTALRNVNRMEFLQNLANWIKAQV